jgi:uncharacterized protein (DUF1499 family)
MLMKILIGVATVLVLLIAFAAAATFKLAVDSRKMSVEVGVSNDRLLACPATPNCVSSDAAPADSHYIAPIEDPDGATWAALLARLRAMEGVTLVTSTSDYAYCTFETKLMRFVDDVEFHRRPERGEIALRSASPRARRLCRGLRAGAWRPAHSRTRPRRPR